MGIRSYFFDDMKIQILDYSTHQGAATLFKRYTPDNLNIETHYICSEDSIAHAIQSNKITHVIHSGSNLSINDPHPFTDLTLDYIRELSANGVKQMGICFGHQMLCRALVGPEAVRTSPKGFEAGWCDVVFIEGATPIPGLSGVETIWQHHFDEVIELPPNSELIATAPHTNIQAWLNPDIHAMGMQFHPEFDRDSGNAYFLNDRELLEAQGVDVEQLIQGRPSGNHGQAVFDYFLNRF